MKLILTNLPSFYKINLYNEMNKVESCFVVYTGYNPVQRNDNFFEGEMQFEHIFLKKDNKIKASLQLLKILYTTNFDEIIISGWDEIYAWIAWCFVCPSRLAINIESSIYESNVKGLKGLIKRLFLSKVKRTIVPGKANAKLLRALGYEGSIEECGALGILIIGILFYYFLRLVNLLSMRYKTTYVSIMCIPAIMGMLNVSLLTAILTCGFGIIFMLMVFTDNKLTIDKLENI